MKLYIKKILIVQIVEILVQYLGQITKAFEVFTPGLHLGVSEWLAGWLAEYAFHLHFIFKIWFLCSIHGAW